MQSYHQPEGRETQRLRRQDSPVPQGMWSLTSASKPLSKAAASDGIDRSFGDNVGAIAALAHGCL